VAVGGRLSAVTGTYIVLELRSVGQAWERTGTVHVELCAVRPEPIAWPGREAGAWVESHATYEFVD
jgi:hypothetical protein